MKRRGDKSIFFQMMKGLVVPEAPELETIVIDAIYLNANRMASSRWEKKGARVARLGRT